MEGRITYSEPCPPVSIINYENALRAHSQASVVGVLSLLRFPFQK